MGRKTEYAKWKSIMTKTDNELKNQVSEQKKNTEKKQRVKKGNQDVE